MVSSKKLEEPDKGQQRLSEEHTPVRAIVSHVTLETAVRVTPLLTQTKADRGGFCLLDRTKESFKERGRPLRRVMEREAEADQTRSSLWTSGVFLEVEEFNIRERRKKPLFLWQRWRCPVCPSQAFEDQSGCPPSRSLLTEQTDCSPGWQADRRTQL